MKGNKTILKQENAAIANGDYEGFLIYCTKDTEWVFAGNRTLHGREAVRHWMAETYLEPPQNEVEALIAEGNYGIATGTLSVKNKNGQTDRSSYCDVWEFRDGRMAKLKAFVIKN